jgi:hypothetical protein
MGRGGERARGRAMVRGKAPEERHVCSRKGHGSNLSAVGADCVGWKAPLGSFQGRLQYYRKVEL